MNRKTKHAFTLVELLVVIGIIGLLVAILLPALGKARAQAQTLKCLSNLRQMGIAFTMYANAQKGYLPYPTTTFGESAMWYSAVDPYLTRNIGDAQRTGVAATRSYATYKQCPVYDTFDGNRSGTAQDTTKEFARTYKMNSMLRHNNPYGPAKITEVPRSAEFVVLGDGVSLDQVGPVDNQYDSGQFSMEVNNITSGSQTWPALRHKGGANILFVDGHASTVVLPTRKVISANPPSVIILTWQGEYVDSGGNLVSGPGAGVKQDMQSLGYQRNPKMPLLWSQLGKLYR